MSLLHSLSAVATKLGLIRVATATDPAAPAKIKTRLVALSELATELQTAEVRALAQAPAEMTVPFEQLFATAGIKPPEHGWSVEKLLQLLRDPAYQSMTREQVQHAVLAALAAQTATAQDVVKDAMARDKAIDAYGRLIFEKRQARRRAQSQKKTELSNQIFALQQQLERLNQEGLLEDQQWRDWWQRKLDYEKQMAGAVNYLLKDAVITIDAQLPADHNCD